MMSPEDRQVAIFMRKCNLEDVESSFKARRSVLPDLDEENQQQLHETMAVLRELRYLKIKISRLKEDHGLITAKRMRLQRECNDIMNVMENLHQNRAQLVESIEKEGQNWRLDMGQYEVKLRAVIDKYRQYASIYDEDMIKFETEKLNKILSPMLAEVMVRQNEIAELKKVLKSLKADVPENILEIIGHKQLEEKLNSLSTQCEN